MEKLQQQISDFISIKCASKHFLGILPNIVVGKILSFLHTIPEDAVSLRKSEALPRSTLQLVSDEEVIQILIRYEALRNSFVDACNGYLKLAPTPVFDRYGEHH